MYILIFLMGLSYWAYMHNLLGIRIFIESYTVALYSGEMYYVKSTELKVMCLVLAEERGVYICKFYYKNTTWYGCSKKSGLIEAYTMNER